MDVLLDVTLLLLLLWVEELVVTLLLLVMLELLEVALVEVVVMDVEVMVLVLDTVMELVVLLMLVTLLLRLVVLVKLLLVTESVEVWDALLVELLVPVKAVEVEVSEVWDVDVDVVEVVCVLVADELLLEEVVVLLKVLVVSHSCGALLLLKTLLGHIV